VGDQELSALLTPAQTAHIGTHTLGVSTPKPGGGVTEGLTFVIDYK
jgi:hypothetical protein